MLGKGQIMLGVEFLIWDQGSREIPQSEGMKNSTPKYRKCQKYQKRNRGAPAQFDFMLRWSALYNTALI